ncbi:MAG TPA: hypothetical protein VET23_11440 [Chitinophagaceae bacterium]|nr:hypothetical protein [Chitinophagaceae bacterium]
MKKAILIATLFLSGFIFQAASAQVRVRFNANIATQPVWGPVGYDHAEYYYMPDIDVFYYVPRHQYIYQDRGRWIFTSSLPSRYRNYDFYRGYKVVINDDPRPYQNAENYRNQYSGYKGNHDQVVIRDSRDSKYFVNKNHPEHNKWEKDRNRKNNHNRKN